MENNETLNAEVKEKTTQELDAEIDALMKKKQESVDAAKEVEDFKEFKKYRATPPPKSKSASKSPVEDSEVQDKEESATGLFEGIKSRLGFVGKKEDAEEDKGPNVLSKNQSKEELQAMGKNREWLKPVESHTIKYGSKIPKTFEFKIGNYAEIYRGKTFMRFAPFVAKTDMESDQAWAEFTVFDFYGKKRGWWPWDLASTKILWIPLDKSEPFCEEIGGGGFKIKVDENSKGQVPIYINLNAEERQKILKNNRMVGQALLLKATLNQYEKPKTNWLFWGIIILVVLLVVAVWALWQTGMLNGIVNWFNGVTHSFSMPPSQQT